MTVYFISGLGADKRVFQKLDLPTFVKPVYLDWLIPQHRESLPKYASRMTKFIDTSQPFYLVGVSFGGMIATEIAKQLKPRKTIILSSVSTTDQLPWYYRVFRKLAVDRLIPATYLTSFNSLTAWFFGATDSSTKQILKQILKDSDSHFIRWAIRSIITWDNQTKPTTLLQIHGTSDRILPIRFTYPDFIIPQGGHLMVYTLSREITSLLNALIVP